MGKTSKLLREYKKNKVLSEYADHSAFQRSMFGHGGKGNSQQNEGEGRGRGAQGSGDNGTGGPGFEPGSPDYKAASLTTRPRNHGHEQEHKSSNPPPPNFAHAYRARPSPPDHRACGCWAAAAIRGSPPFQSPPSYGPSVRCAPRLGSGLSPFASGRRGAPVTAS